MAKTTKKVIRKEVQKGHFTTVHHSYLYDKRLTAEAFRILVSMLADADNFNISQRLFENRFGIHKKTVKRALKCLEECGYLRLKPLPRGNYYTISEYGNLNIETSDSNSEEIIEKISKSDSLQKLKKYFKTNVNFLENEIMNKNIIGLANKHLNENGNNFEVFKSECDNYIKSSQKIALRHFMKLTNKLSEHYPKKTIEDFEKWLNDKLYKELTIPTDEIAKKQINRIKQRNYKFKTDLETAQQDRMEEEWDDMH